MQFLKKYAVSLCAGILASATLLICHIFGFYPEQMLAWGFLRVIAYSELFRVISIVGSFVIAAGLVQLGILVERHSKNRFASHEDAILTEGIHDKTRATSTAYESPIWKAIQHVAICIGEPKDTNYFPKARVLIRQAALDGHLTIWGKKQIEKATWATAWKYSDITTKIERDYWSTHVIKSNASVEMQNPNVPFTQTESYVPSEPHGWENSYADLRASEEQINILWPEKPRRMPVLELLNAAEADGWIFLGDKNALYRFTQGLRQAASEGVIEIWGLDLKRSWDMKSAPNIYTSEKIPAQYFKEHWIELHQGWMNKQNCYTCTSRPSQTEPNYYSDLHVDRIQALLWLGGDARHIRDTT